MTTWLHEWLFRRPSRVDSLCRRRWDLQESGGQHLRREHLLGEALREESRPRGVSSPEEEPRGSAPKLDEKATKLLEANLRQRPFGHPQRAPRLLIHALTGLSVSRSTICRAIARIGSSRKKGDDQQRS